jgi:2-haloacid dehalogenase
LSLTPPLTTVVFDIGGVLLDWDPRHLYRKLFDGDDGAMEAFLSEVCTLQWHVQHDLGHPAAPSCQKLAERYPEQADLIWAWARRTEEMVAGPIAGTVSILLELNQRGVPCYGLSNMEAETFPVRLERYPFLRLLDGFVISGHEGVVKPDPRIFRLLLERFGLEPGQTLFVDDSPANVTAAEKLGIRGWHFTSPEALRSELVAAGLLAALRPADGAGGAR